MSEIRIVIADDHALLRSGLKLLINTQPDMAVVGEAGDFTAIRERVSELQPNIVTLDLSMPGGDAIKAIEGLSREFPAVRILVLTMHDDSSMLRAVFAAGASGYLVKSAADTELLNAIRSVAAGRSFINLPGNPDVPLPVKATTLDAEDQKALDLLSVRENEVLTLVAQGHTNQAIADRLFLSVKTVESYRSRLMAKLNMGSRAELTQFAVRTGLLKSQ
jgi:two-component system response regulator NreC